MSSWVYCDICHVYSNDYSIYDYSKMYNASKKTTLRPFYLLRVEELFIFYQDHDALVSNTQMAIRSTYIILTELEEKFEDRKWVIRSRKSKKDNQY
jgi:hypothetical protein